MFFFRINKLKIIDNKERPRYLGLFGPDVAQVKLISFVTTDVMQLPDMSDFIKARTKKDRKIILQTIVDEVIHTRILTTIENVKDNHVMYFGDTGYVLYQSSKIPNHFDWQFLAYESDQNVRDAAQMVWDIVNDDEFDSFTDTLRSLLAKSANPAYTASVSIGKFATKIAIKTALNNLDDMIGIVYMSLNRYEHYPHGERKRDDVPDMTNNMLFDYSIFAIDEKKVGRKTD